MGLLTVKTENVDGQIYQTMKLDSVTGTASTALAVPFQKMTNSGTGLAGASQHVFCTAKGDDLVFKFGADSTTAASASDTSGLMTPFNFIVLEGQTKATDLNSTTQSWVSVISLNDTTGGTGFVELINNNV